MFLERSSYCGSALAFSTQLKRHVVLLQHKHGKYDTPERLKQLVTTGSEAELLERAGHQNKLVSGNESRRS